MTLMVEEDAEWLKNVFLSIILHMRNKKMFAAKAKGLKIGDFMKQICDNGVVYGGFFGRFATFRMYVLTLLPALTR